MPRYFFDVHDGRSVVDDEGFELPSFEAAKLAAFHLAGGLLKDIKAPAEAEDWQIEVRSDGQTVFRLRLLADASG
jgi:hypothetical protein